MHQNYIILFQTKNLKGVYLSCGSWLSISESQLVGPGTLCLNPSSAFTSSWQTRQFITLLQLETLNKEAHEYYYYEVTQ